MTKYAEGMFNKEDIIPTVTATTGATVGYDIARHKLHNMKDVLPFIKKIPKKIRPTVGSAIGSAFLGTLGYVGGKAISRIGKKKIEKTAALAFIDELQKIT